MRSAKWMTTLALAAAAAMLAACTRDHPASADAALQSDLALAAQAAPANSAISPTEAGFAATPPPQPLRASSVRPSRAAPVHRTATHRSSGIGRSSAGSGAYYPAPAPPAPVTVKHTERDAAIGAATGAVLGATTSRNKIRGGLIGAALGGVLGGMIGNNVDIQKKPGGF